MKSTSIREIFVVVFLIGLPIIYLSSIYNSLPAVIPTHFNYKGEVDGTGEKATLWVVSIFMSCVSVFTYLVVKNANKIDPKKNIQSPELLQKIAYMIVIFISAVLIVIIQSAKTGSIKPNELLMPLIGFLFAGLGNFMHSIKPNYFIGMRLPWTLEDPENWRKTHQVGSKLWMIGGILIAVCSPLMTSTKGFIFSMIVLSVMVVYPIFFSYQLFKKSTIRS
ncbi:SdpI family protein [Sediminibacterium sp.]|uniref:SdpI family protein n=1 Tax=Sediminibacterium sp. TaxID=1917865 RepID=UPI003F72B25F